MSTAEVRRHTRGEQQLSRREQQLSCGERQLSRGQWTLPPGKRKFSCGERPLACGQRQLTCRAWQLSRGKFVDDAPAAGVFHSTRRLCEEAGHGNSSYCVNDGVYTENSLADRYPPSRRRGKCTKLFRLPSKSRCSLIESLLSFHTPFTLPPQQTLPRSRDAALLLSHPTHA